MIDTAKIYLQNIFLLPKKKKSNNKKNCRTRLINTNNLITSVSTATCNPMFTFVSALQFSLPKTDITSQWYETIEQKKDKNWASDTDLFTNL